MTALVTPPGQSPDEPAHLARAAGLLHFVVVGERWTVLDAATGRPERRTGFRVDRGLFKASNVATTQIDNRPVMTTPDFLSMRAQPQDHSLVLTGLPNTATYFPAAYVPATAGLILGLALRQPPYACFLLARLGMLLAFLVLGGLALWVTAWGEALLLTILLLPMTLFLGATVNQDGVLIAAACLVCAALTRGERASWLAALVLFVLFLGGKPPYFLLLGVFLLPLFGPGFWVRLRDVAIACVPVLAWVAVVVVILIVPYGQPMHHPGPLFAGDRSVWMDHADSAANLQVLLAHPGRFLTLPLHTMRVGGEQWLRETVGVLGFLQIELPDFYDRFWGAAGVAALLGLVLCRRPGVVTRQTQLVDFCFVGVLLVATVWLILIMLYLDWTFVGNDYIEGPQGRYWIPLLPFLLLAVPGGFFRLRVPLLVPAIPSIALGVFDIGYVPMKLVLNYYLH